MPGSTNFAGPSGSQQPAYYARNGDPYAQPAPQPEPHAPSFASGSIHAPSALPDTASTNHPSLTDHVLPPSSGFGTGTNGAGELPPMPVPYEDFEIDMDLPSQLTFDQLDALLARETSLDPTALGSNGSPLIPHALLGEFPPTLYGSNTPRALASHPASPAMRHWLASRHASRKASRATSPAAQSPAFLPPFNLSAPPPSQVAAAHYFASHSTTFPPLDTAPPSLYHHHAQQAEPNVRTGLGEPHFRGASLTRSPPSRANTLSPSPSLSDKPSPNSPCRPDAPAAIAQEQVEEARPPVDPWDTALRTAGTQSGLFSAQEKSLLNNFMSELEWAFHPDLPDHLPTLHPPSGTPHQPPYSSSHAYSYPPAPSLAPPVPTIYPSQTQAYPYVSPEQPTQELTPTPDNPPALVQEGFSNLKKRRVISPRHSIVEPNKHSEPQPEDPPRSKATASHIVSEQRRRVNIREGFKELVELLDLGRTYGARALGLASGAGTGIEDEVQDDRTEDPTPITDGAHPGPIDPNLVALTIPPPTRRRKRARESQLQAGGKGRGRGGSAGGGAGSKSAVLFQAVDLVGWIEGRNEMLEQQCHALSALVPDYLRDQAEGAVS